MPWFRAIIALILTVLVVGSYPAVISQMLARPTSLPSAPGISEDDRAALAAPFHELAAGQEQRLLEHTAPVLSQADWARAIHDAHAALPPGRVESMRLMNWDSALDGGRLAGVFEILYPAHVVRAQTDLAREGRAAPWRVVGLHLDVASKASLAGNRFTLHGKPPLFYAMLALVGLTPIFVLLTALDALFAKTVRLRWLWVFLSMLAFCELSMDTASGIFTFTPLSFLVFGAAATWSGSLFEPWILSWAIPVGALVYWILRPGRAKASA
jgi:hypothetical protein